MGFERATLTVCRDKASDEGVVQGKGRGLESRVRTLEEVGEHFNLTRERIRQIEARAMSKLRHPSSDTGARDLLSV